MSIIVDEVTWEDKTFGKGIKKFAIGGIGRILEKRVELHIFAKSEAGPNDTENDIDERIVLTAANSQYGFQSTLTREQNSFLVDGFIVGDLALLEEGATSQYLTIKEVSDSVIVFEETITGFSDGPSATLTLSIAQGQYAAIEVISAWNTNSNKAPVSLVDGSAPRFSCTLGSALEPRGPMSGYLKPRSGHVQAAAYISDSTQIEVVLQQHVGPFFEDYTQCDGDYPSFFYEEECVNWYTKIRLLKSLNNPNEAREVTINNTIANTGYLDQNYNQGPNPYYIEDVVYTNYPGNRVITGIQIDKPTEINFVLKSPGLFTSDTPMQACFTTILEGDGHKNNQENYVENVYFENSIFSAVGIGDGTGSKYDIDGEGMQYVTASYVDSSTINCKIRFSPGAKLRNTVLNEERKIFLLWLNVELLAEADIQNTKEVPVKIACGNMITDPNLDSLLRLEPLAFFEHDEIITTESKATYCGYLTDDIFVVQNIGLRDILAEITNIKIGVYAEYSGRPSGGVFPLEEYDFKTEGLTFDAISTNISRGYLLSADSDHNRIKIVRNTDLDGEYHYLKMIYAWRIRYEDWVKKNNVPDHFYDVLEENDGKHEKWDVYEDKASVYFKTEITIKSKETGEYNTEIIKTRMLFGDYGELMDNTISWSPPTQKTFESDGVTEISDNIQRDDITVMQYDFVSSSPHGGVANYYGECHAENYQAGVLSLHEISTENTSLQGLLIPNVGQTTATLTEVNSTTLRLSFSVDPNFVNKSKVSFYPRIGRKDKPISWIVNNENTFDASFDAPVTIQVEFGTPITDIHPITSGGFGQIVGVGNFTIADFSSSNLIGWADFTRLTGLDILNCENQTNLKNVFFPKSSVLDFQMSGCDLSDVNLTMTDADAGGSDWEFYDNLNLQFIEFKTGMAGTVDNFDAHNCDLDYIDISPILNSGMTIDLSNNYMRQEEVDAILADCVASLKVNVTLTIDGTNEAPGVLGLADKTTLEGLGWTVTVTV